MSMVILFLLLVVIYLLIKQSIKRDELEHKSIFKRIENNNKEIERLLFEIKKQKYQITTAFRVSNEDAPK